MFGDLFGNNLGVVWWEMLGNNRGSCLGSCLETTVGSSFGELFGNNRGIVFWELCGNDLGIVLLGVVRK